MSEHPRSEQACPVCGEHTLALDQPPQIDVMGVQPYSDLLGMGDLHSKGAVGIVCLNCDTHWRDKAAFDRNEPERDISFEPSEEHFGGGTLADADASSASGGAADSGDADDGGGDGTR